MHLDKGSVNWPKCKSKTKKNSEGVCPLLRGLTLSYTGGGGHKVPELISKIRIFAMNTATATKFGDFS